MELNEQIMGRLIETPQYLREIYYSNTVRVITPLQIIFEEEDQRIEFDEQSVSRLRMVNEWQHTNSEFPISFS